MHEDRVYRCWERARSRYFQRYLRLGDDGSLADSASVFSLFALLLALPLDLTLMSFELDLWGLGRLADLPGIPIALAWGGVLAVNGLRIDRQLARWRIADRKVGLRVRLPRWLLSSLPLASLIAVAVLNRPTDRYAGGGPACPESPVRLPIDSSRPVLPRRLPASAEAMAFGVPGTVVCFLAELVAGGVAGCWLTGRDHLAIAGVSAVLHVLAGGVACIGSRARIRHLRLAGWRRHVECWVPVLCLAPSPLGMISAVFGLIGTPGSNGLVWMAFAAWNQPTQSPVWWGLRRRLRRRHDTAGLMSRWTKPSGGSWIPESLLVDQRVRELVYAKALLTVGDGLLLGWGAIAVTGDLGKNVTGSISWTNSSLVLPISLAAAGVAITVVGYLGILLRAPGCARMARRPYGDSLVWVGWALTTGLVAGKAVAGGAVRDGTALLALSSVFPILISSLNCMLRPLVSGDRPSLRELAWWLSPVVWAALALCYSRAGSWYRGFAVAVVVLIPFWHLAVGRTLGRWLLWPYRLRDLRSREVPQGRRLLLAFLVLTALLPAGGLAAPLWIFVRQRLGPDLGRCALSAAEM